MYNVDRLHEAISTGKMVTFGYQKSDGQLSHPTDSPWQMAPRTGGQQLLYNVDRLHEAISTGKMVTFGYQKSDGQLSHPTDSPWQMAWDGGYYYLIAYLDQSTPSGIRDDLVDRM